MAVSSTRNRVHYTGDGTSTAFAVPFRFLLNSDIAVYLDGVRQFSGFTTTGGGGVAGTVTFSSAPVLNVLVTLVREQPYTQDTVLAPAGPFPAKSVETMADKAMIATQQALDTIGLALRASNGDPVTLNTLPLSTSRYDRLLGFENLTGQPVVTPFTITALVSTIAAAYIGAAGPLDALSFIQEGLAVISRTAQNKARESFSVKDFAGVVGDGIHDDTAGIQAAVTAAYAQGRSLYFPRGTYLMSSTITMGNTAQTCGVFCHLYGEGRHSIIKVTAANVNPFLWQGPNPDLDGAGNRIDGRVLVEKLQFQGPSSGAGNTNSIAMKFYGAQGIVLREVQAFGWRDALHFQNCDIVTFFAPLLQANYNGINTSATGYAIAGEGQLNSFNIYGGLIANTTNYGVSYVGGLAPSFFGVNFAVNGTSMIFSPPNVSATTTQCPSIHGCYLEGDTASQIILGGGNGIVRGLSIQGGNMIAGSATPLITVANYSNSNGRGHIYINMDIGFAGSSKITQASSAEKVDFENFNGQPIGDVTPDTGKFTSLLATSSSGSPTFYSTGVPSAVWGMDFAAQAPIAVANNGTYDLAAGSGLVIPHATGGGAALFLVDAGSAYRLGGDAIYVSGVPGAGEVGLYFNGGTGKYRLENKSGGSLSFRFGLIRTRPTS